MGTCIPLQAVLNKPLPALLEADEGVWCAFLPQCWSVSALEQLLFQRPGECEECPWAGLGVAACWAWYLRAQIKHLLDLFIPQHWEEGQQLSVNLSGLFALV